jgi:DNA helicase-2/ATP-dependent DNA helicase PcrA
VIVQAGPGTGKTHTLLAKLGLELDKGTKPQDILALTFTQRAAQDMKQRLQSWYEQRELPFLGTFHAYVLQEMNMNSQNIISQIQRKQLITQILAKYPESKIKSKELELIISKLKNRALVKSDLSPNLIDIFNRYQRKLKDLGKVDYDDLLIRLEKYLNNNSGTTVKYLLVDEFQDLNRLQLDLIETWLPDLDQLFVIGDANQAIYGFRGAEVEAFEKWQKKHDQAKRVRLTRNYRSAPEIISVAGSLFPNQGDLEPTVAEDGQVELIKTLNQFSEARAIKQDIEKRVGGTGLLQASDYHQEEGARFSDFAVIYRTHFLGRAVKKELEQAGIPFQQLGQESIYAQPEVNLILDLIWLLKKELVLAKLFDLADYDQIRQNLLTSSLLRLKPSSSIKLQQLQQQTAEPFDKLLRMAPDLDFLAQTEKDNLAKLSAVYSKLAELTQQTDLIQLAEELINQVIAQFDLNDGQLKNIYQLKANLLGFMAEDEPYPTLFKYVQQLKAKDFYDQQADKVSLLTMHAAKGLEFDWVYLVGFEQGQIPLVKESKLLENEKDRLSEEKRLLYVAMTRAKKGLFLFKPKFRWKNSTQDSEFLNLIRDQIEIRNDKTLKHFLKKKKKQDLESRQSKLF